MNFTSSVTHTVPTSIPDLQEVNSEEIELGARLGSGAFGDVYAARCRGSPVAVKRLNKGAEHNINLDELRCLAAVRHPNVILVMGYCLEPFSILTEKMDTDLYSVLHVHKTRLSEGQRWHIALSIARGLAALHQHKPNPIVHRDLKVSAGQQLRDWCSALVRRKNHDEVAPFLCCVWCRVRTFFSTGACIS
jgi:serine/threonine protein kinase